jgi:hypothetical protein
VFRKKNKSNLTDGIAIDNSLPNSMEMKIRRIYMKGNETKIVFLAKNESLRYFEVLCIRKYGRLPSN